MIEIGTDHANLAGLLEKLIEQKHAFTAAGIVLDAITKVQELASVNPCEVSCTQATALADEIEALEAALSAMWATANSMLQEHPAARVVINAVGACARRTDCADSDDARSMAAVIERMERT